MRILIVSNLYPPNVIGGYEVLCAEVSEGLARYGHDVTVLTSCFGGRPADETTIIVHQALQLAVGRTIYDAFPEAAGRREVLNRANTAALLRVVEMARPDVVFCWNLFGLDEGFLARICAGSIPVVMMLTDNWLVSMTNPSFVGDYFRCGVYSQPGHEFRVNARQYDTSHTLSASAIFGSAFMRDFHGAAGLRFGSHRVIHNGIQQPALADLSLRDRSRIGTRGKVSLLFAGRVVEIKGAHVAVEALGRLRAERPDNLDFELSILGSTQDEAYLGRLRQLAEEHGCLEQVRFLDQVPQDILPYLFQEYDILLFPSLYEPFSLTLIHAMASGIPVVASSVGGNTEIVSDGDTGLLSERNDPTSLASAVTRLAIDATLRSGISERGMRVASTFTLERMLTGISEYLTTAAS